MDRSEIKNIVLDIVSKGLGADREKMEANPNLDLQADLGCDSVRAFTIISMLEGELDAEIPYDEFRRAGSIENTIDFIAQCCGEDV